MSLASVSRSAANKNVLIYLILVKWTLVCCIIQVNTFHKSATAWFFFYVYCCPYANLKIHQTAVILRETYLENLHFQDKRLMDKLVR